MKANFYALINLLKTASISETPIVKRKLGIIARLAFVLCVSIMASDCSKKSDPAPANGRVIFWTASATKGGSYINIYVSGAYQGQITGYYSSTTPDCGASGSVTFSGAPGTYNWNGVGQDGTKWSSTVTITTNSCFHMQLY